MDTSFCLDALKDALRKARPEIFNIGQGAQFSSTACTDKLEAAGVQISTDDRGRWLDNVFVERLWGSLKYEEVDPRHYTNGLEARIGIGQWFRFYNKTRAASGFELQNFGGGVGGQGEPCGFAAALGRRRRRQLHRANYSKLVSI
jgi:putative transposase